MATSIEWSRNSDGSPGETWNPIRARHKNTGKSGWYCQKVSPGCAHCYAESMNQFRGNRLPYTVPSFDQVELYLDEKALLKPLSWSKPRSIFVCSMTDLFADFIPDEWLDRIHAVMAITLRHNYKLLTKRPHRLLHYMERCRRSSEYWEKAVPEGWSLRWADLSLCQFPLPNVWHGTTVCNQDEANRNILPLLQTPSALHFISAEPLLGPINLRELHCSEEDGEHTIEYLLDALTGRAEVLHSNSMDIISDAPENPRLGWVITGGESGNGARPYHTEWAESLIGQCRETRVSVFVKQLGAHVVTNGERRRKKDRKGADMNEWPHEIRVQEIPEVANV